MKSNKRRRLCKKSNVLFTIADMQHLIFKGQVSQVDAAKLHLNMPATIEVAALPDLKINGTLTKLALQSVQAAQQSSTSNTAASNTNSSDSQTSPFSVGFTIEISDLQLPEKLELRAGYSANADIIIKTVKNTLALPERVIQFDGNQAYVWLPNGDKPPKKQNITLGISDGIYAQILSGLALNEKVLANTVQEPENN